MKKFLSLVLSALILVQFTIPVCAQTVKVKSGTSFPVTVTGVQTSKALKPGAKIDAEVQRDVFLNDVVIFKKGSKVLLNVVQAKKAGFLGNPGELTIAGGEVFDANNEGHPIDVNRNYVGNEKTWPKVCLGISIFFLFPLALCAFVKGGQAQVPELVPIEVRTVQDFDFTEQL